MPGSFPYPLLYNGPLNYFARLVREKEIHLEQWDHYGKQSYRNRCRILGPNGPHSLSIPVSRKHGQKTLYKDIRIDYELNWHRNHWKSLVAAYAHSPYFELMADELAPFYERKYEYLVDLNLGLLETCLGLLGPSPALKPSTKFTSHGDADPWAYAHSKREPGSIDPGFNARTYHQVFSDRHGFVPNLSILDLLFNMGPESLSLLKGSL